MAKASAPAADTSLPTELPKLYTKTTEGQYVESPNTFPLGEPIPDLFMLIEGEYVKVQTLAAAAAPAEGYFLDPFPDVPTAGLKSAARVLRHDAQMNPGLSQADVLAVRDIAAVLEQVVAVREMVEEAQDAVPALEEAAG